MKNYKRQGQGLPGNMMPSLINIEKEKCLGCDRFIWTHNKIMTCDG